jgi:hypothetical protein
VAKVVVERDLELPSGAWQLRRFGAVYRENERGSALFIFAQVERVGFDIKRQVLYERSGERRWILLPIGEIAEWDIGTIFCVKPDSVHFGHRASDDLRPFELTVTFEPSNMQLLRRANVVGSVEDASEIALSAPVSGAHDGLYLRVKLDESSDLVMPATTVLKAFWGVSSTMILALTHGYFDDPLTYVYGPDQPSIDNGVVSLCLRKHMLDADAAFVALLAVSPKAVERATRVAQWMSALAGKDKSNPELSLLAALPPIDGSFGLKALGFEKTMANRKVFLVTQVVQVDWPALPFHRVEFRRETDTGPGSEGTKSGGDGHRRGDEGTGSGGGWIPRFVARSRFSQVSARTNPNRPAHTKAIGTFGQMNPVFDAIEASKVLPEGNGGHRPGHRGQSFGQTRPPPIPVNQLSVNVRGRSLDGKPGPSGLRITGTDAQPQRIDDSFQPLLEPLSGLAAEVSRLLTDGSSSINADPGSERREVTFQPVRLWNWASAMGGGLLFSLPGSEGNFRYVSLYCNPGKTVARRGLCLQVDVKDHSNNWMQRWWLIELEGRYAASRNAPDQPNRHVQTCALLVSAPSRSPATNAPIKALERMALNLALQRTNSGRSSEADALVVRTFKHAKASLDMASIVQEMLAASKPHSI